MRQYLPKAISGYFTRSSLPYWVVLCVDCLSLAFSAYVGMYFQMGGLGFASFFRPISITIVVLLVISFCSFRLFRTYKTVLRFSSFVDLLRITSANLFTSAVFYALSVCVRLGGVEWHCIPDLECVSIIFIFSSFLMGLTRVIAKTMYDSSRFESNTVRVFIFGVQTGGVSIAKGFKTQQPRKYSLAGFVDPGGSFCGHYLMGVKVYPNNAEIIDRMNECQSRTLIVSPLQMDPFRNDHELVNRLTEAGFTIMLMHGAEQWDGKSDINNTVLREAKIEDLLPREPINVDMTAIMDMYKDKRLLVTGAAGSIGSEIVHQLCECHPSSLVLVDQAETPMHDLSLMLKSKYPYIPTSIIVASITDARLMDRVFAQYRPQYVFHAAAYKHVPMMEDNPSSAVLNNVVGTRVIADLSVKYDVGKFVMISTDKAVNPTNVMGCSKRICEIYCQSLDREISKTVGPLPEDSLLGRLNPNPRTRFVTTRFGNVLGSNGSVIPIFHRQIKSGGPVTVTDPEIIRYFMLIPEACKLVLEAGRIGDGGEILVFDMGKPVKIADLAKRMIALSGASGVQIKYTGLREGEKLYEELLSDKENVIPTVNNKIMVAKVREYDYAMAKENEDALTALAAAHCSNTEIVMKMKEIVPEYRSTNSKYCKLDS